MYPYSKTMEAKFAIEGWLMKEGVRNSLQLLYFSLHSMTDLFFAAFAIRKSVFDLLNSIRERPGAQR